jgi:hypothetical protein
VINWTIIIATKQNAFSQSKRNKLSNLAKWKSETMHVISY